MSRLIFYTVSAFSIEYFTRKKFFTRLHTVAKSFHLIWLNKFFSSKYIWFVWAWTVEIISKVMYVTVLDNSEIILNCSWWCYARSKCNWNKLYRAMKKIVLIETFLSWFINLIRNLHLVLERLCCEFYFQFLSLACFIWINYSKEKSAKKIESFFFAISLVGIILRSNIKVKRTKDDKKIF